MADIGVLDLQIQSTASSAATNLGNLADALSKVKAAVAYGTLTRGLDGAASALERIKAATKGGLGTTVFNNLTNAISKAATNLGGSDAANVFTKTAEALERMSAAYKSLSGTSAANGSVANGRFGGIMDNVRAGSVMKLKPQRFAQKGTEQIEQMQMQLNNLIKPLGELTTPSEWTKGGKPTLDFSVFDPSKLPLGALGMQISENTKEVYQWGNAVRETSEVVKEMMPKEVVDRLEQATQNTTALKEGMEETKRSAQVLDDTMSSVSRTAAASTEVVAGGMEDANSQTERLTSTLEESAGSKGQRFWEGLTKGAQGFREGLKNINIPFTGLFNSFKRIARNMAIRAIIRQFTAGIKEGTENMYRYSQAIGSSFAPAMDSIASTMAQFRNSLGAAAAPALTAIIPVLNAIASAAITALNALSQLFALLGGATSWTKAVPQTTTAFNDIKKSAGGAGGAVKELLADFDELNVIASQGGGGGGGGGAGGLDAYADMFKDMFTFDKGIKDFVDWLKKNLESIKGIVIAIGTAIAAWKLANAFAEALPWLSKIFGMISTIATIAATLQLNWVFTNTYLETGNVGWLIADALTTAVGATLAWTIAKKFVGAGAAKVVLPLTLTLSAITGIVALVKKTDVSAFSKEALLTTLENALKVGGAAAYLMYSVGGAALGTSLIGGAAIALGTFGVFFGLKTLLDKNVELFSLEDIIGAISAAAGIGWLTFILSGGVIPWAAGAAVATFAVYFGIKAMLNRDKIEWGDVELTDEEVQAMVAGKIYNVNVPVATKLINETIDTSDIKKEEIEAAMTTALGTLSVINLGINDGETYANLQGSVTQIVETISSYVELAKKEGSLTLEFTPKLVGTGESEQGDWIKNYTEGWNLVEEAAQAKGREIGELLAKAEAEGISANEQEVLNTLMQQLNDLTSAITRAQINSNAFGNLQIKFGQITEQSADKVIDLVKEYKTTLTEEYTKLVNDQYTKQGELVAALLALDPEAKNEITRKAMQDYEEMGKNLAKAVEDGVKSSMGQGREFILEWLLGNHGEKITSDQFDWEDLKMKIQDFGEISSEFLSEYLVEALEGQGFNKKEIEIMELLGITGFEFFSEELQKDLVQTLGTTVDAVTMMKDALGLDVSQILSLSGFSELSTDIQLQMMTSLTSVFGASETVEAIKAAGIDIGSLVAAGMSSEDTAVQEAAKKWKELIDAELGKTTAEEDKPQAEVGGITEESTTAIKSDIENAVTEGGKDVTANLSEASTSQMKTDVKTACDEGGKDTTVTASTASIQQAATDLKTALEAIEPHIQAHVSIKIDMMGSITLSASVKGGNVSSVQASMHNFSANAVTIDAYAGGAYGIPKGDLFLAKENGPEMVGRIGGRNTVANQDQIVEGISAGVADGMEGANDPVVKAIEDGIARIIANMSRNKGLQPSSDLGRTVSKSLQMYGIATGKPTT